MAHVTKFAHVGLSTSNLDQTLLLFREILGFEVTEIHEYSNEVVSNVVGIPDAHLRSAYAHGHGMSFELLQYIAPRKDAPADFRPCNPGHAHIALWVDDLDAMVKDLAEFGFSIGGTVQNLRGAGKRSAYVYGPDALVLELSQPLEE